MKTEDKIIAKTNVFFVAQEIDLIRREYLKRNIKQESQQKLQSYYDMLIESLDYFQDMDKTITESNKKISELKTKILNQEQRIKDLEVMTKNMEI